MTKISKNKTVAVIVLRADVVTSVLAMNNDINTLVEELLTEYVDDIHSGIERIEGKEGLKHAFGGVDRTKESIR